MSTPEGKQALGRYLPPTEGPTFSSEGYQRGATGPFASNFRSLIPDPDSRDALDFDKVKASWRRVMDEIAAYYRFDDAQKAKAAEELSRREALAGAWFDDPENREKIRKHFDALAALEALEGKPRKMSYEVERCNDDRKAIEAERRTLVAPVDAWTKGLADAFSGLATEDQKQTHPAYRPPMTEVQKADYATMIGLTACGLLLMIGLFTPVAALGGATFLMLFYLSQPPFPGLPVPPNAEGHYLFVNKNLIEFLALLALAATPSGLWLGVDALLFGWIERIRYRMEVRREARAARTGAGPVVVMDKAVDVSRKPKTR